MKTLLKFSFLIFAFGLLMTSCKKKAEGTTAETKEAVGKAATAAAGAKTYKVNTGASKVNWTGGKALGDKHMGTLNLSSGVLSVDGGELKSGSFVINMGSLTNTDQKGEPKQNLEGHLKSPDFFDVANHPIANFVITNVAKTTGNANATHKITGDLEILGQKKSISFDAHVGMAGGKLSAVTPAFVINRTDWGIKYGSSSLADIAKDKIINDEVSLVINLSANAQ